MHVKKTYFRHEPFARLGINIMIFHIWRYFFFILIIIIMFLKIVPMNAYDFIVSFIVYTFSRNFSFPSSIVLRSVKDEYSDMYVLICLLRI